MRTEQCHICAKHLNDGKIELWNTDKLADTSNILISFEILVNGDITDSGEIQQIIPAGGKITVSLTDKPFDYPDSDIFINIIYTDKAASLETAREQLTVSVAPLPMGKKADTRYRDSGSVIDVSFKRGSARFDRKRGFVSYTKHGREYLLASPMNGLYGFVPHVYQDTDITSHGDFLSLNSAEPHLSACKMEKDRNGRFIRTVYYFTAHKRLVLARATVDYRFDEHGKMTVTARLNKIYPFIANLPCFGLHAELEPDLCNAEYYGRGALSNRNVVGKYSIDLSNEFMGNSREEVRWGHVSDNSGITLTFRALNRYLYFNVSPLPLKRTENADSINPSQNYSATVIQLDGYQQKDTAASDNTARLNYANPLEFSFEISPEKL